MYEETTTQNSFRIHEVATLSCSFDLLLFDTFQIEDAFSKDLGCNQVEKERNPVLIGQINHRFLNRSHCPKATASHRSRFQMF